METMPPEITLRADGSDRIRLIESIMRPDSISDGDGGGREEREGGERQALLISPLWLHQHHQRDDNKIISIPSEIDAKREKERIKSDQIIIITWMKTKKDRK